MIVFRDEKSPASGYGGGWFGFEGQGAFFESILSKSHKKGSVTNERV
jgi:hypothetical protein